MNRVCILHAANVEVFGILSLKRHLSEYAIMWWGAVTLCCVLMSAKARNRTDEWGGATV